MRYDAFEENGATVHPARAIDAHQAGRSGAYAGRGGQHRGGGMHRPRGARCGHWGRAAVAALRGRAEGTRRGAGGSRELRAEMFARSARRRETDLSASFLARTLLIQASFFTQTDGFSERSKNHGDDGFLERELFLREDATRARQ